MSNELTLSGSITFNDTDETAAVTAFNASMTGTRFVHSRQAVGFASDEIIQLGELTGATLGWCWVKNLDSTNFMNIKTAASGTVIVKLKAGEFALFRFGSGVTAPAFQADTAAVLAEFRVYEA